MAEKLPHIRDLIKNFQFSAKKSLGQNFLVDENIFQLIAKSIKNVKDKNVIEIGPGLGSLTRIILSCGAKKVIAIEQDITFAKTLEKLQSHYPSKLEVIHEDALKIDESSFFPDKYVIISNLPYNISTELLFKWLGKINHIEEMFLMFQKEVADRIVAVPHNKDYGKLAIISQLLTEPEILFDIQNTSFIPVPKVTSSFVHLKARNFPLYEVDIKKLQSMLGVLFNFRRKMLRKSLKMIVENPEELLKNSDILPTQRPEELTIRQFCTLSSLLSTNNIN